jgi:O-methyltransferase domain
MAPSPHVEDWHEITIVAAALRTGIVERLAEPRSAAALARDAGLDVRATTVVARAMEGFGYLTRDGERFALAPRGRELLGPTSDGRDPAAEIFLAQRAISAHLQLADALLDGRPVDDVSHASPEEHERFLRAMRNTAAGRVPATLAAIGTPPPGARLLDAGGAPGTYARAFAKAGWGVTVLDIQDALSLTAAGLETDGIHVVEGDMTVAIPGGPWDVVYLGNVTHLFDPETVRALLVRAGASLSAGGLLAVQDIVRGMSGQAARFGVFMLLGTEGGDTYDEAQYRGWMELAGCPVERIVDVEPAWHQLILGRKAG